MLVVGMNYVMSPIVTVKMLVLIFLNNIIYMAS
ncbi:hypothetical protein ICS_05815 [Bacillus cereus BAG2O-3]|nr:hypothetical protein ICS_05815 [Bacillus cereus BAG2O-3]EOQ23466.1 hypothetical protein KQ1_05516 [Bacillus cereus BAG3O-1]SCV20044.1 Uncharacterized protein BCRIVMBC845_02549 [Bacillus cereus]